MFRFNYSNRVSKQRLEKITDQVHSTSSSVAHDDWIHLLSPVIASLIRGGWTPYFLSIPPSPASISFEITYYSERMAVFEAGMYIVV